MQSTGATITEHIKTSPKKKKKTKMHRTEMSKQLTTHTDLNAHRYKEGTSHT